MIYHMICIKLYILYYIHLYTNTRYPQISPVAPKRFVHWLPNNLRSYGGYITIVRCGFYINQQTYNGPGGPPGPCNPIILTKPLSYQSLRRFTRFTKVPFQSDQPTFSSFLSTCARVRRCEKPPFLSEESCGFSPWRIFDPEKKKAGTTGDVFLFSISS